jgi:hypothetical protein
MTTARGISDDSGRTVDAAKLHANKISRLTAPLCAELATSPTQCGVHLRRSGRIPCSNEGAPGLLALMLPL